MIDVTGHVVSKLYDAITAAIATGQPLNGHIADISYKETQPVVANANSVDLTNQVDERLVIDHNEATRSAYSVTNEIWNLDMEFKIHSVTPERCKTSADAFVDWLRSATITMSDGITLVSIDSLGSNYDVPDATAATWAGRYQVTVQRTR